MQVKLNPALCTDGIPLQGKEGTFTEPSGRAACVLGGRGRPPYDV